MRVVARVLVPPDVDGIGVARRLCDSGRVHAEHAGIIVAYRPEHAPLAMSVLTRARKKVQLLFIDGMFHT